MFRYACLPLPLLASACTTTSFAPPPVNRYYEMTQGSLSPICEPTAIIGAAIDDDVRGARSLIRNHIATYECAMRAAANGRQWFEVPAFLSLVGSSALVALGKAGRNTAILGATGNSIFTAGQNYYAPQEQTTILRSAVDALACIQSEASGIAAYTDPPAGGVRTAAEQQAVAVELGVEQQYYDLISSRLSAVNSAAAQRLAQRGTFDAAGVAAEIKQAAEDLRKAEEAKEGGPPPAQGVVETLGTTKAAAAAFRQSVKLDLDVLRPRLDLCVVRAKA